MLPTGGFELRRTVVCNAASGLGDVIGGDRGPGFRPIELIDFRRSVVRTGAPFGRGVDGGSGTVPSGTVSGCLTAVAEFRRRMVVQLFAAFGRGVDGGSGAVSERELVVGM